VTKYFSPFAMLIHLVYMMQYSDRLFAYKDISQASSSNESAVIVSSDFYDQSLFSTSHLSVVDSMRTRYWSHSIVQTVPHKKQLTWKCKRKNQNIEIN